MQNQLQLTLIKLIQYALYVASPWVKIKDKGTSWWKIASYIFYGATEATKLTEIVSEVRSLLKATENWSSLGNFTAKRCSKRFTKIQTENSNTC